MADSNQVPNRVRLEMRTTVLVSIIPIALLAFAPCAGAADLERGRSLYESRCSGCHGESVHGRANRVAKSFEEITAWVARWNATLALKWGADEVEDVSAYLNATYYRFACPSTVCKVTSQSPQKKKPA